MGEFDNCCFCISLKTGCLIIGYMHLFGCVTLTIEFLAFIASSSTMDRTTILVHDETSTYTTTLSMIVILVALFTLTFIIMLLVGIHKNKPGLVLAYLFFDCISFILDILGLILYTVIESNWYMIAMGVIYNFLTVYCIFVIIRHYMVMKDSQLPYHTLPAVNNTYSVYVAPTPPVYNDSRAVFSAPPAYNASPAVFNALARNTAPLAN